MPVVTRMNLLFIGDIFGRPGRDLVRRGLGALVDRYEVDLVIANVENAAGGFGITREIGEAIAGCGVDVMTTGNHVWDKKEALDYVGAEPRLLRPANYPPGAPGRGSLLARTADGRGVGVINLMGRVFMTALDDPFAVAAARARGVRRAHARHHRGLPRRGHLREDGDGLASRRQGERRDRHAHARADRRRAGAAEGHRVPDRRGHDRAARLDHRHRARGGRSRASAPACPSRFEPATGNPRLHGARDRRGRGDAAAPPPSGASTFSTGRTATRCGVDTGRDMTSLFDLPFEAARAEPSPSRPRRRPRRTVWTVSALTARDPRAPRDPLRGRLDRGRDLELPALEHRPPVLHAQGRGRADQGGDVPLGRPRVCASSPRTACACSRAGGSACTTRRASTRSSASTWSRRASGALQLAFEQLKKRLQAEGLFDAARKRPLPALPRRIGIVTSLDGAALRDIIKVITPAPPERAACVIRPTRVQGEGAAAEIARALQRGRARRPAWTSSSSGAAAARSRTSGRSTRSASRGPSRDSPGAGHLGRRPRDRLHDRRLRGRRPRPHALGGGRDGRGRARTSSARGSTGSPGACPAAARLAHPARAGPRAPALGTRPGWRAGPARSRFAAGTWPSSRTSSVAPARALVAQARTPLSWPAAAARDVRPAAAAGRHRRAARAGGRAPCAPPRGRRSTAATRGSASRRPVSTRSALSPCSDAATRSAGTQDRTRILRDAAGVADRASRSA